MFEAIQNNPWQTRHKYADISMSSVLPNILNKYFASIGHKLGTNTSQPDSHFTDYLKDTQIRDSFFCTPITSSEVESEILSIPNKKFHGLYSCPTKILKCARSFTSKAIAEMINISIQSGIYPSILKHAKVIPVFKTGDVTESDNYRPISLLCNLNKILEKVMYKRFINFIENKNILHHSQYGFRQQYSTQHAILDIVNKIQANIDKKEFTCGIFIDLKKAFDTVDHTILLCKLQHYGFRGIIHDWLSSYPFQVVTSIYRSLILPYLSYGITIWGNTSQIFLKKLLVLQKRVLRIMHALR